MRNMGKEHGYKFEDMSSKAGLKWQESFGSPSLGDYDNDGDLDLYYTTVYGGDHCVLYRNNGDWTFTDVTSEMGIKASTTYQATWVDYDNDGDLDLLTNARLYRNNNSTNHWLKVRLLGAGILNQAPAGTIARIELKGKTLLRQIGGGTGEGNQNDPTLHFGLGDHTGEVKVQILWTDGTVQTVASEVDKTITIKHTR